MPRMYVEDTATLNESPRATVQRLMRELDDAAAREGHAVIGDVAIMEYEQSPLSIVATYRLEADVEPR